VLACHVMFIVLSCLVSMLTTFTSSLAFFFSLKSNLSLQETYYSPSSASTAPSLSYTQLYHHNEGHYRQHTTQNKHDNSFTTFTFPTRLRTWSSSSSSSYSTLSPSPATNSDDFGYGYDSEDETIPPVAPTPQSHLARTTSEKQQALHLLATSVTEQGSTASYILLTHPYTLLLLFLILMITLRWCWTSTREIKIPISVCLAILLVAIITAKVIGRGYACSGRAIEQDGWLAPRDEIVVATVTREALRERNIDMLPIQLGNTHNDADNANTIVVGALILRYHPHEGKLSKKGRRVGRGWIRGWAVRSCLSISNSSSPTPIAHE